MVFTIIWTVMLLLTKFLVPIQKPGFARKWKNWKKCKITTTTIPLEAL